MAGGGQIGSVDGIGSDRGRDRYFVGQYSCERKHHQQEEDKDLEERRKARHPFEQDKLVA